MHHRTAEHSEGLPIPRGWILLGAGVTGWGVVAAAWTAGSAVFSFVLSAV